MHWPAYAEHPRITIHYNTDRYCKLAKTGFIRFQKNFGRISASFSHNAFCDKQADKRQLASKGQTFKLTV